VLLSTNDAQSELTPSEGEWPLREALLHIVNAERTFFAINDYGLKRARTDRALPPELSDEDWEAFWTGDRFEQDAKDGPVSTLMAYYEQLHWRVLDAFADIADEELDTPVFFWESQPMTLRFRLHRFNSHLRQHTIQIEKGQSALGLGLGEARRLLRLVFAALAQVEGVLIGMPTFGQEERDELATQISQRLEEVLLVVGSAIKIEQLDQPSE
jgi:hypothetical protein